MSVRQIANLMSAGSQAAGGASGADAIKSLTAKNLNDAPGVAAALGLNLDKDNNIDISSIGKKGFLSHLKGMNDKEASTLLTGLNISQKDASAFIEMAKHSDKFSQALDQATHDTKTFSQSAEESKDNLDNAYKGMINGITEMFTKGAKALGLEGLAKGGMKAIGDNPLVAGGAMLGSAALAGILIKSLGGGRGILGKIPGLGFLKDQAGLASGVAKGKALQAGTGVTPVYVTNASEIGGGGDSGLPGGAAGLSMMGGFASKLLPLLTNPLVLAGIAAIAGTAYATSDSSGGKNQYGQKYSAFEKMLGKLDPTMSKEEYRRTFTDVGDNPTGPIKLEADWNSTFTVRPSMTQLERNGVTQ
jgi:hypothetical protein